MPDTPLPVIVATSTWNSIDIIEQFLTHYSNLGVEKIYVAEYHSSDGTREVLTSARWAGFVESFDVGSLTGLDSSNRLLEAARQGFQDAWCLFCDPDEFLVIPSMQVHEPEFLRGKEAFDAVSLARFNMTALVSAASAANPAPCKSWVFRIAKPHHRDSSEFTQTVLKPAWIFTALPGKVVVRLASNVTIGPGDHEAIGSENTTSESDDRTCLLHYPVRSYDQFEQKIRLARLDLAANPSLPSWNSWHWRRWATLLDRAALRDEYNGQFIADKDLPGLLDAEAVVKDERIAGLEWIAASSPTGVQRATDV